jgi:hypothetical protein
MLIDVRVKTAETINTPYEAIEPHRVEVNRLKHGDVSEILDWVELAAGSLQVWEIRWNKAGSLQGHYIPGSLMCARYNLRSYDDRDPSPSEIDWLYAQEVD